MASDPQDPARLPPLGPATQVLLSLWAEAEQGPAWDKPLQLGCGPHTCQRELWPLLMPRRSPWEPRL